MKKMILVILIAFIGIGFVIAEDGVWDWKDNFASTTYGVALMPVDFNNANKDTSNTVMMTGIDIRLFNGKNITTRGGFYTGTEVGVMVFFSGDEEFSDSYTDALSNTVDYTVINSDSFIGMVFVLAKYGYRLDLGVKLFGISLGWEMGIGARIASGNFDYNADIGGDSGSRSEGYDTTAMSMILDTAVEGSIRLGTSLRFVAKVGFVLTPPLIDINDSGTPVSVAVIDPGEADNILANYDVESFPVIPTARVGFIVSY